MSFSAHFVDASLVRHGILSKARGSDCFCGSGTLGTCFCRTPEQTKRHSEAPTACAIQRWGGRGHLGVLRQVRNCRAKPIPKILHSESCHEHTSRSNPKSKPLHPNSMTQSDSSETLTETAAASPQLGGFGQSDAKNSVAFACCARWCPDIVLGNLRRLSQTAKR